MRRKNWSSGRLAVACVCAGCAAESEDPCASEADPAACADAPLDLDEHRAALGRYDLVLAVHARSPAGAGTVTITADNRLAYCAGNKCLAVRGADLSVRAVPAPGVRFSRWSGCSDSTEPVLALRHLRQDVRCDAHFVVQVSGFGSTPLSPRPIPLQISAEGAEQQAPGVALVPFGADVTLTVPGLSAAPWRGCVAEPYIAKSLTLQDVSGETTCIADVTPRAEVRFAVEPTLGGSVRGAPESECYQSLCLVPRFGSISLTALPNAGYRFVSWRGCGDAATPTITLTEGQSESCVAVFAPGL